MNRPDDPLTTPIRVLERADAPWLADQPVFYTLAANGLFVCRNHPFFRSCVPAPDFPSELAEQRTFLDVRYPKVPRRLFELIVGFFDRVGKEHSAEAGVLLAWDSHARRIRPIVPEQRATVSRGWGGSQYPIGLHYEVPTLPPGWTLLGDVHSHVDGAAYASGTDQRDEAYRAGLHIVVGRIDRDPPDVYVAAVVDRTRFTVAPAAVIEGYEKRCLKVPPMWMGKLTVEVYGSRRNDWGYTSTSDYGSHSSYKSDGYYGYPLRRDDVDRDDRRTRDPEP
jgi:hypothetical protein